MKGIATMCITAFLAGCSVTTNTEDKIDELYAKMSQEERIAQLRSMYMDELFNEDGQLDTAVCRQLIPYGIGHFSQYASQKPTDPNVLRDRVAAVQQWLMHNTPNGIPALFHEEVLSGVNTRGATIYPQQIGQACSFNPELAYKKTWQTGIAMRRMGGVLSLSPMVDVCRTPSFNRLEESYGEDAYLSAVMGTAFVRGLQQGDLYKGVGACAKHYLGYGGGGDADEKELMEEILLPHETMIRLAGCRALMPGYHAMKASPKPSEGGEMVNCVANSWILQDILRDYLGFDGMVVSDYTAIDQLPASDVVAKAAAAINGGCDVDFPLGSNYLHLQTAIDSGLVKPEVLQRAVKDVLRYKLNAGLLTDNPYLYSTEEIVLDTPEERQTAYDIATQSVVLLENNGILPLRNQQKILLTGPNANTMWAMCGDYSFPAMTYFWKKVQDDLDHPHVVTLLEGMQNYLKANSPQPTATLMYSRGCDWTEEIETQYNVSGDERAWEYEILHRKVDSGEKADPKEALAMAQKADVIIAAMGENVMLCGENRDRKGLRLPGRQEQYVEELLATGKPVVLILFGGRAQVISGIAERCAAVIQAWYPGEEGGNAVADILFGEVSPSAKLSVSYPNTEVYEPICYSYTAEKDPRVQWPFGYGLSYTTFEYSDLQLEDGNEKKLGGEPTIKTTDTRFYLTFCVENTGSVTADEIAQVYLSPLTADPSPLRLQGFERLTLTPGEKKTVKVKLYTEQLGYYTHEHLGADASQRHEKTGADASQRHDQQRQWNIAPGSYMIKVGASSADIRLQQQLTLQGKNVVKPLREYYFSESQQSYSQR